MTLSSSKSVGGPADTRNVKRRAEMEWSTFADKTCTTDAFEGMISIFMVVLKLRIIGPFIYAAKWHEEVELRNDQLSTTSWKYADRLHTQGKDERGELRRQWGKAWEGEESLINRFHYAHRRILCHRKEWLLGIRVEWDEAIKVWWRLKGNLECPDL